jgi:serine/threonine protein kinase
MLIPNKKLREMNRRQQVKRRVGKYEVGRTIGEGTFAKVKFARNSETGEPVALKILDKEKVLKHKMAEQVFVIIELWILCFRIAVFYRLILILLVFFC